MTLLVDTSVWSLAFRRDAPRPSAHVEALVAALDGGEEVAVTGLILHLVRFEAFPVSAARHIGRHIVSFVTFRAGPMGTCPISLGGHT